MLRFSAPALKKQVLQKASLRGLQDDSQFWTNRDLKASTQGFTLIEVLGVVAIVAILSAIAAPAASGWIDRNRMKNAVSEVQDAVQETQRQAIRSSRSCSLTLNSTGATGTCLVTGDRQLQNVSLQASTPNLQFNLKGALTNSAPVTIVISSSTSTEQRCLVVSAPLGLVRTGSYSGTGPIDDDNCRP